jgi:hypothetical protein
VRFATLVATDKKNIAPDGGEQLCGDHMCRGAYLVEEPRRHAIWLLTFSEDRWLYTTSFHRSETQPAPSARQPAAATKPDWAVLDDAAIVHEQAHNHGTERLSIALRKDRFVVTSISDDNRQGEDARSFGKQGRPLVGFRFRLGDYTDFKVAGPKPDPTEIPEPAFEDK